MANTLILVDKGGNPWKKVNVRIEWNGGGYDHVWVDESGRGSFSGTGTVNAVHAPGEVIYQRQVVKGDTTFIAQSDNAH